MRRNCKQTQNPKVVSGFVGCRPRCLGAKSLQRVCSETVWGLEGSFYRGARRFENHRLCHCPDDFSIFGLDGHRQVEPAILDTGRRACLLPPGGGIALDSPLGKPIKPNWKGHSKGSGHLWLLGQVRRRRPYGQFLSRDYTPNGCLPGIRGTTLCSGGRPCRKATARRDSKRTLLSIFTRAWGSLRLCGIDGLCHNPRAPEWLSRSVFGCLSSCSCTHASGSPLDFCGCLRNLSLDAARKIHRWRRNSPHGKVSIRWAIDHTWTRIW